MGFGRPWDELWPEDEDPPGGLARRALEHLPYTAVVAFDRDLRLLLVAGPALNHAGLHRAAVEGLRLEEVVAGPAAETLAQLYRRTLAGEHVSLEYRSSLTGHTLWLNLAPIRGPDGDVHAGIAVTVDVTTSSAAAAGAPVAMTVLDVDARRRPGERLQFIADHDPLTSLPNRRALEHELMAHVTRCRRYGADGALLAIDLDRFRAVSDRYGHHAADGVLTQVAGLLRSVLRQSDVVAHGGGDEFFILLPRGDALDAVHTARTLLSALRDARLDAAGEPVQLTASIGVAVFADEPASPGEMLVHADLAMYDAKDAGRDDFVVYSEMGGARTAVPRSRLELVEEVRSATDEDRLLLYAQPVVPVGGGPAAHRELLLRMRGANDEVVPPSAFLPAAERFGLIGELDRWVLTQAIALLRRSTAAGATVPVSVNVSARSLRDDALLDQLSGRLRESGVDPRLLIVEIAEGAAIADLGRACDFAAALRRLGCQLALDDFGSGFGSFLYLEHLPFDLLKIDGEYVSSCLTSQADQLVIEAVMTVARGLGTTAVAKFAPDADTLRFLAGHGVELTQSFLTGAPAPLPTTARPPAGAS